MKKILTLFILLLISHGVVNAQEVNEHAIFRFVAGKDMLFSPWGGNGENLQRITEFINLHKEAITSGATTIYVNGHCASVGSTSERLQRTKMMSNRVKSEIIMRCGVAERDFTTSNSTLAYEGERNLVVVDISIYSNEPLVKKHHSDVELEPKVEPKAEPKAEPLAEPKAEPQAEPLVEPKSEPMPTSLSSKSTEKMSRWSVGANIGIPFFWGDMVSMSAGKTYVGIAAGAQGSYRISKLLGVSLSADWAQGKSGARGYAKNYLLAPSGITYYHSQSGGQPYSTLYSKISVVSIGVSLDVNINRIFFKNAADHRFTVWVSPTVYGQFFNADIYTKSDDHKYSNGATQPDCISLGLGGALSLRYRVCRSIDVQLKNSLIWITDNKFDGVVTSYGQSKQNAMWTPQLGVIWNISNR
ncbi:MAG: hypothetical protein RR277_07945 [Rikenellaceae bacterium]